VVRGRKEWAAAVGIDHVLLDGGTPIAVFLLVGDQTEREALGIEPKVVRIHGNMWIHLGTPSTLAEALSDHKFFWGIAIGRRDAVQDFFDTGDPDGISEPFGDASESDFLMWGVEVISHGVQAEWSPDAQPVVLSHPPTCCDFRQVKVDVKAQRRLEKEDCIYWVIQYVSNGDDAHKVDFDARILVAQ